MVGEKPAMPTDARLTGFKLYRLRMKAGLLRD